MSADGYRFRSFGTGDRALVARWRAMPHVAQWWGAPKVEPESEKEDDPRIAMWIVAHEGRPFAFAQDYDVHGWDQHPFAHLPPGSRGIDQYIGEADMLGRGHGTAFIREHLRRLFEAGAPAVGTDPHPDNHRSRRASEKAGFVAIGGPVETRWSRAILMECWAGGAARTSPGE